jgi:hypothetical protein
MTSALLVPALLFRLHWGRPLPPAQPWLPLASKELRQLG